MDEISDHAKVLTLSDDLERTVEERVNILFDFVKVNLIYKYTHHIAFGLSNVCCVYNWLTFSLISLDFDCVCV